MALAGNTAPSSTSRSPTLQPFLAENWRRGVSPKTGNPVYEKPVVLVIYREDCRFLLDHIMPRRGGARRTTTW